MKLRIWNVLNRFAHHTSMMWFQIQASACVRETHLFPCLCVSALPGLLETRSCQGCRLPACGVYTSHSNSWSNNTDSSRSSSLSARRTLQTTPEDARSKTQFQHSRLKQPSITWMHREGEKCTSKRVRYGSPIHAVWMWNLQIEAKKLGNTYMIWKERDLQTFAHQLDSRKYVLTFSSPNCWATYSPSEPYLS